MFYIYLLSDTIYACEWKHPEHANLEEQACLAGKF